MTLNLNCCPNFSLGTLCTCKSRPGTESPEPIEEPPVRIESRSTLIDSLGDPITLVDTEQIHFESLLPSHHEYLYIKIKEDKTVVCACGGLLDDLKMTTEDLKRINICSIKKNPELFRDFICPLVTKTLENGTAYQFCFKIGSRERLICCSIYPCSIPGSFSSVDCVIRPVVNGFRPSFIDKFVLPLDSEKKKSRGNIKINTV